MHVELYNRLDQSKCLECRRVLFRDEFEQPFCLVIEQEPRKYWIKHLGDKEEFNQALRLFGVQNTSVVDRYHTNANGLVLPAP